MNEKIFPEGEDSSQEMPSPPRGSLEDSYAQLRENLLELVAAAQESLEMAAAMDTLRLDEAEIDAARIEQTLRRAKDAMTAAQNVRRYMSGKIRASIVKERRRMKKADSLDAVEHACEMLADEGRFPNRFIVAERIQRKALSPDEDQKRTLTIIKLKYEGKLPMTQEERIRFNELAGTPIEESTYGLRYEDTRNERGIDMSESRRKLEELKRQGFVVVSKEEAEKMIARANAPKDEGEDDETTVSANEPA